MMSAGTVYAVLLHLELQRPFLTGIGLVCVWVIHSDLPSLLS